MYLYECPRGHVPTLRDAYSSHLVLTDLVHPVYRSLGFPVFVSIEVYILYGGNLMFLSLGLMCVSR